jgi:hypothetical protein
MKVERERKLEPLKDLDLDTYLQTTKKNELELFENEIALGGKDLGIPTEIMELSFQAQSMLSFYCDRNFVNPETLKHTYNNILESYIASLEDSSFVEEIYEIHDLGEGYKVAIVRPEKKPQYIRLKQKAISLWKQNQLSNLVNPFKELMSGGRSKEDLLKDDILDEALYDDDKNYRLKRTNQAIKVLGLDKNIQMSLPDVWNIGGGKQLHSHMKKQFGGVDYTQIIEEEQDE